MCITDSIGALFVLPVPMVSFIKGYWDWSDTACTIISTTTACCWTMHLVAVALYRADRVFAVWLPTGRYPLISARIVNGLLVKKRTSLFKNHKFPRKLKLNFN